MQLITESQIWLWKQANKFDLFQLFVSKYLSTLTYLNAGTAFKAHNWFTSFCNYFHLKQQIFNINNQIIMEIYVMITNKRLKIKCLYFARIVSTSKANYIQTWGRNFSDSSHGTFLVFSSKDS